MPPPDNPEAERLTLGYILITPGGYSRVASQISTDDFSLEKHRRIFARMGDLSRRAEKIDRVTLANELQSNAQLQSVDGLSYIISLDDGLPPVINIDSYVGIIKKLSIARRLISVQQGGITDLLQRGDVTEIAQRLNKEIYTVVRATEANPTLRMDEYINSLPFENLYEPWLQDPGLKLGFEQLDEATDGLHESEIAVFAAPPGGGKTAWLLNIISNVFPQNLDALSSEELEAALREAVLLVSLEMPKRAIFNRLACARAGVSVKAYRAGNLTPEQRMRWLTAVEDLRTLPIFLEDTGGLNHVQYRAKVETVLMRQSVKLAGFDFVQLAGTDDDRANENTKLTNFCHGIQQMGKDLKLRQILLSQLSRDSRKLSKKPGLHDLRGSGTIEQVANVIAFLYYEDQKRVENNGLCSLLLAKNREGDTKEIKMRFTPWLGLFEERPRVEQ